MQQTPLKLPLSQSPAIMSIPSEQLMKYITVTCRLKPLLPNQDRSKIEIDKKSHSITLNDPTKSISKTYSFDEIFDECVCQDRFTNSICQPLVRFLKNGGDSGLIFSYGITNSGKTYTILGTKEQPGVLLNLIKILEQQFKGETLRIVACQLYKDQFVSLRNKGQRLHPKELRGTFTFEECQGDIINQNNMQELFNQYLQNRSCSSTNYNMVSSRSHAIFKISCSKFKIGIVDLAGSQRSSKGHHENDIKETIFINSSLLTLKKCIKALEEKSGSVLKVMVPYRESKLTQALMEYFVPSSKINIIVNINQARHCLEQNLNVMDYTSKAKNITANATSDFSMMLKSTARKKNQVLSALRSHKSAKSNNANTTVFESKPFSIKCLSNKSKKQLPQSQQQLHQSYRSLESIQQQNERKQSQHVSTTINSHLSAQENPNILIQEIQYQEFDPIQHKNQHKMRYSVQFKGQNHKYIIDEDILENQPLTECLMQEIQKQQRRSYIENKQNQLLFKQYVQKPLSIENFIKKQQQFRNYLQFDREFQQEDDARKLSALRKVNLLETNKKPQSQPQSIRNLYSIQKLPPVNAGSWTGQDWINSTEFINEVVENVEFDKLRTQVKRKLMKIVDDEKKKMLIDADTMYSQRKQFRIQQKDKFQSLNIDEVQTQNQQSNFTTPSKNHRVVNMMREIPQDEDEMMKQSQMSRKNIISKTFDKISSGVKSGVKFVAEKVGLGNNVFRTNNKNHNNYNSFSVGKKKKACNMKIRQQIAEMINPSNKIYFEATTNTQVDLVPSSKKVLMLSQRKVSKIRQDGQIELDGQLELFEQQVVISTCEVGIQTDTFEVRFTMAEGLHQAVEEQKKNKKNLNKKNKKTHHDEKKQHGGIKQPEIKQIYVTEKTAFKHFSMKKNEHSLQKRKAFVSNVKLNIAKNTRGAQRRRQGHN